MAVLDVKKKVIKGKIVYYGPGLCGKTTNLEHINSVMKGSQEMMSLATEGDRTIFFDFLPMDLGKVRGISTKFKLYTVPGQVRYNLTRKMVLKNVAGVVFVADSQLSMMDSNIESLENLFDNLKDLGLDPDEIPIVLQYNKRDLPDLASPEELDKALNHNDYPVLMASAIKGDGVLDTLKKITRLVFDRISATFEGKGKASKKKAASSDKPMKEKPQPEKPPTMKGVVVKTEQLRRERFPTDPQQFGAPKLIPAKPPQEKKLEAVADRAPARDTEKSEATTDAAAMQGLEDLRVKITALVKQQDMILDSQQKASELAEKKNQVFRNSVSADISEIRAEIVKSRKELDHLHRAMAGLKDQIKAAPLSGSGAGDLDGESTRLLEQMNRDLATKKEVSDLQKSVAGLADGLVTKKELSDLQKSVAGLAGGLATKKELSDLQKSVAGLSEHTDAILATQRDISVRDADLKTALRRVEAQTDALQSATTTVLSGLREEIERSRKAGSEPKREEPPARKQATVPRKEAPAPRKEPAKARDLVGDPRHQNAARAARVMVADLLLYHPDEVSEGIRNGDLMKRMKAQMETMRQTYEARIPEDVRKEKDHLAVAIEKLGSQSNKQPKA